MKLFARLAALTLFVAACASPGPTISTNSNPATDFTVFKTYNFASPLGTDRPGGLQTPLSTMLMTTLAREMENRGYVKSDDPDLLVNVFVNTEEKMSVRQVPTTSTYYGYRYGRYSTWGGYTTEVREYTKGTLVLDLVDARQNMLAWEGTATQRLSNSRGPVTQERVDEVVGLVMAQFPYGAMP